MSYLDELGKELARVGIRGRNRSRILAEAADHLAEGEESEFGNPRELAQLFADELATKATTRAAYVAFGTLGVAGAGYATTWLAVPAHGWPDIFSAEIVPLGVLAALVMLIGPQVAFAAGLLALLRAWRLRRERAAPAAELALLARRTRLALGSGGATMVALAVYALDYRAHLHSWFVVGVAVGASLLTLPLAAAAVGTVRAAAVRSGVPGTAGDVFDDLPFRLPRHPWRLCLAVAALTALAASPGSEGDRNAVVEAVLVVVCFAAFGRRLGLRR
jgi:hypothetical protein